MCIVLFSYKTVPGYRLVAAANRDEFYARPTAPLSLWDGEAGIVAGRDLQAGGTWLGVNGEGRFCALTNYRESLSVEGTFSSRGEIVEKFLTGKTTVTAFSRWLQVEGTDRYHGFSLLYADEQALYYCSNRDGENLRLAPGIYGLSNGRLNNAWPKVERGKKLLQQTLDREKFSMEDLFTILLDDHQPEDAELPDTGVGIEWERLLGPIFIRGETYGTRSSAVILIDYKGNISLAERSYSKDGERTRDRKWDMIQY